MEPFNCEWKEVYTIFCRNDESNLKRKLQFNLSKASLIGLAQWIRPLLQPSVMKSTSAELKATWLIKTPRIVL